MRKHFTLICVLFAACALGSMILWQSTSQLANNPPTIPNREGSMFDLIDEKARIARSSDEHSVRELAEAVFSDSMFAAIPPDILGMVKERLVRAEMNYRRGNRSIREQHIYRLVDQLADRFGAPDYARTSPLQVRIMRVSLMERLPNFIAVDTHDDRRGLRRGVGTPINPEVSPLEAVYITTTLIWQKILNRDWQQTPQEWEANQPWRQLAHRASANTNASATPYLSMSPPDQHRRSDEMLQLLSRRAASMRTNDVRDLMNTSLDSLGIER